MPAAPTLCRAPCVGRPPVHDRCRCRGARGERGVSIVLAMLVLFVLVVVVFEIRYSASVEQDQARMIVEGRRMGLLAEAGKMQALTSLIMDIEQALGGGEGADASGLPMDTGGDGGDGGGPFANAGDGGGGDEGEDGGEGSEAGPDAGPDIAGTTASTDSRLDEWNDPLALAPSFGEDYQVLVEVEDEDGKINLLGMWTADEVLRDAQREILIALLDKAFEGTTLDLSFPDAMQILDRLDDWARGNRGAFETIPLPPLKTSNAEDAAEEDGSDVSLLLIDEKHRPLTLDELALIEGLKPEHLNGFVENDEYYPGLDRYLTVWSQLELKPPPPEPDPFGNSPFTNFTQGSLFDKTLSGTPDEQPEAPAELTPDPTNDGLVNVNTAPLVVLRALAPMDVPTSFLEKLDEFRSKIDELKDKGAIDAGDSLFGQDKLSAMGEDDQGSSGDEDDEEDPTKYVFSTVDEVIDKVEQEYDITLALDPEVQSTFYSRLAVTSSTFTIKVLVYTLTEDQSTGEQRFGRRASYRTVVWRMVTDEGARMLTLLPLEPYFDPRRLADYGLDLDQFGEDHAERMREEAAELGLGF
jgi:hypothetical protein